MLTSIGNLVLRTTADGTRLRLGDVAVIKDGLEERLSEWHYDGQPTQGWEIHTQYSAVEVARRVNDYVARQQLQLPEGLSITTWWDDSQAYEERVRTPGRRRAGRFCAGVSGVDLILAAAGGALGRCGYFYVRAGRVVVNAGAGCFTEYAVIVRLSAGDGDSGG